jgi:hypothetical protein
VHYNHGRRTQARESIKRYFASRDSKDDLDEAARALVVLCDQPEDAK